MRKPAPNLPHHAQADKTEQIVAEAEQKHPDLQLTEEERRDVAKVVASKRALKKLPLAAHATATETRARVHHKRTVHRHTAEVTQSLGETHGEAALAQAEKEIAGGVNVGEIAEALRALRVTNLGQMCEHLAPPPCWGRGK